MPKKQNSGSSVDIYKLLLEAYEKKKKEKKAQLLRSVEVKEYFEEGNITINMKTCKGVECKLCIEACPSNALFWKAGEIGIVEDLCVFCGACVFNCIVDDCIQVRRKRPNGKVERFSTPKEVLTLLNDINSRSRVNMVKSRLPTAEAYLRRYGM